MFLQNSMECLCGAKQILFCWMDWLNSKLFSAGAGHFNVPSQRFEVIFRRKNLYVSEFLHHCGCTQINQTSPASMTTALSLWPYSSWSALRRSSSHQQHIKDTILAGLDNPQFGDRENHSTEDAVSLLHAALTHLQHPDTYVRILFLDFSSAFNTCQPWSSTTWAHHSAPGSRTHSPTGRNVTIRKTTSAPLILNTAICACPQVPKPVPHSTNMVVKFADDTTLIGRISNNDETHYRDVQKLMSRQTTRGWERLIMIISS